MRTKQEIIDTLIDSRKAVDEFEATGVDSPELHIHKGWVEALEYVLNGDVAPEPDEGELNAMHAVADLFKRSNYPKNLNGIFGYATPIQKLQINRYDDPQDSDSGYAEVEGWEVDIHFGHQDDVHNDTYTVRIYIAQIDIDEWLAGDHSGHPRFQDDEV